MMMALVGALVGAVLPPATAAAAPPAPRLAARDASAVLAAGGLAVRVSADRRAVVRVGVTGLASGATGAGQAITPQRSVRFSRAGSRTLVLPLTASGRALLASCTDTLVRASATQRATSRLPARRSRRRARHAPRRHRVRPAFTGAASTRVGVTTLHGVASRCYRVGIGVRTVNPAADGTFDGQVLHLGGYGFGANPLTGERKATGILGDGVSVRALAVSDGTHQVAIADVENQGMFTADKQGPYGLIDIRKAVEQATGGGLKAAQVIVQADHSHGGPDLIGAWGGVPLAYKQLVVERTVEAIVAAYRSERLATLRYGQVDAPDLLTNQFAYDPANTVLDSGLRVLQARGQDGRTFATLLNFSAHPTVLGASNTKATGDWPQEANRLMEQRFGGRAMTMVGTLGRTQPARAACPDRSIPPGDRQSLCMLDDYAGRVVDRAAGALSSARPITGPPAVAATSFLIQDVGSSPLILGANYAGEPIGAGIYRALTPPWLTGTVVGTVTASARIGDVLLSTFPGEAYPQIALAIQQLVPGMRGYMTAGLADDQLGYLIAPFEAYPEPIRRAFFNQRGDQVSPIDNDNYFFNVSMTMGERVLCSALRGAGEVLGRGLAFRNERDRCAAFPNDLLLAPGADTG